MFLLYAKSAHHLSAIRGVDTTHRYHREEEDDKEDNANRLRNPVVEWEVLWILWHDCRRVKVYMG